MDIGSVIGYRAKKDDVRSGLFVELLHGGKCYSGEFSFKHLIPENSDITKCQGTGEMCSL